MLIYRVAMVFLAPALAGLTVVQRLRGRVGRGAVQQRLGIVPRPDAGLTLWLHGASNGELTSALPVLRGLLAARAGMQVLVTANTGTAVEMVQAWRLPGVRAALSPVDGWGAAGRVLARWRPALLVVVENELWPARLVAAQAAGVPVALIGGRMSQASARTWGRIAPNLMRGALRRLAYVSAQDAESAARLVGLGLPEDRLGPVVMLKAAVAAPVSAAEELAQETAPVPQPAPQPVPQPLSQPVPRPRVLLAASTHPGEEVLILQGFAAARGQFDLLILAPRHPRRGAEVAGVIAAAGYTVARRSAGAMPGLGDAVFLADTLGEMGLWYAMAGATVIGGSFVPLGGHTPYEPAAAGSALVHGPHMENFAGPAAALAQAAGALAVGRSDLAAALAGLDAARQAQLAQAARKALRADGDGGLGAVLERLLGLLDRQEPSNG